MFGIGFVKSLHEEKEENRHHVVTLPDTNSVVNFHFVFCIDLEFEFEVMMESTNDIDQHRWCTISC